MISGRALLALLIACALVMGCARHTSRALHPWLGLAYNSDSGVGALRTFAAQGIAYDRNGNIEPTAGDTLASAPGFAAGLRESFAAGMLPDVLVDPAANHGPRVCSGNTEGTQVCLPTSSTDVRSFVSGFVKTASSVLRAYPQRQVLFEPMDEPWLFATRDGHELLSGQAAAGQYADVLAALLPAALAADIPLGDIYVPATGQLMDGTSWIPDLYAAQPCLAPGGPPCSPGDPPTPIEGWNVHPYGLPGRSSEGIDSVPKIRDQMLSGADNVVISEIGFCQFDVPGPNDCSQNRQDIDGTGPEVAAWLHATLKEALPMHRAGWLKALIVWARNYPWRTGAHPPTSTGWAMQNLDGSLTAQGRVLVAFAEQQS